MTTINSLSGWPLICGVDRFSTVLPAVDFKHAHIGDHCILTPVNMRFTCKRAVDTVDDEMKNLYRLIIEQRSHEILNKKSSVCGLAAVMGHCGNSRGALTECACESLNRLISPELRLRYENEVLNAAVRICSATPRPTQLNIAIFASGGLHGEEVLMLRLIDRLKKLKFNGVINLFLMDLQYQENIEKAFNFTLSIHKNSPTSSFLWDHFIGDRKDLSQFLTEIARCLPTTIKVEGTVFGDAFQYIERAKEDSSFCHDLLIGADIEGQVSLFSQIKLETHRRPKEPGLVLIKDSNLLPRMCTVNSSGELDCSLIRRIGPLATTAISPSPLPSPLPSPASPPPVFTASSSPASSSSSQVTSAFSKVISQPSIAHSYQGVSRSAQLTPRPSSAVSTSRLTSGFNQAASAFSRTITLPSTAQSYQAASHPARLTSYSIPSTTRGGFFQ